MIEYLPNLAEDINIQIQETEWISNTVNPKEFTLKFLIDKLNQN